MGLQVTASKVGLLLECSRPFASETKVEREEVGEAAKYGSALHEVLYLGRKADVDAIAAKWGVEEHATELHAHAVRVLAFLRKWMGGDNPYGLTFHTVSKETHRAARWYPGTWPKDGWRIKSAPVAFDEETHTYQLGNEWEFGGTEDIVLVSEGEDMVVVVDYKSGDWGDFHTPSGLPQMLTLAEMVGASHVAILHAPRMAPPTMYVEEVTDDIREAFGAKMRAALGRIGDGSLRPGAWCNRCPARESCPAKDGELLVRASSMIARAVKSEELQRPVDKGAFHLFLQELDRLAKRGREELRNAVRAGEVIARPDGKVLVMRMKEVEGLSKASIIRALGKERGGMLIAELRALGCVTTETREELHAVNEG